MSWAPGNSTFTTVDRPVGDYHYTRTADGTDALYPEIEEAWTVTITSVDGADRLDLDTTSSDGYDEIGVRFRGYAGFNGQSGSVSHRVRPNATSLATFSPGGFAYLTVLGRGAANSVLEVGWDALIAGEVTAPSISVRAATFADPLAFPYAGPPAPWAWAADRDYTVRLCWSCGTPTVSGGLITAVASDGWIRVYIIDGLVETLAFEATDLDLFLEDGTGTANAGLNYVREVHFGNMGLLGAIDQIVFNDESCETQDNPPGPGGTPGGTCCDHTGPGGSPPGTGYGPPGETPPVNTPRVIPPGGEEPEYNACTGGGDPATATDPTDAQSLTNAVSPVFWLQLSLPDATVLRYNSQGLNFTSGNGSVSTPRVLQWGEITHALADEQASVEAFRTSVTLADADRAIRTHLGHATNRHIDSREAIIFVETRANAALGTAPLVKARGVITNWHADTDLTVTIEIADPLGFRYSAISLDRPYPFRRISANFFPGCPEQNLGRAVPDIYGDYGDDQLWAVDARRIPIGINPVIDIGPAAEINGLGATGQERACLIAGHALAGIQSLFGSNNHEDGPASVRLSLASAEFNLPGLNGWPLYHDITGLDGTVERFAIMTGIGPRMDAHVNGQVPITLNVCGTEDVGDGSGDVITNAVSQVQHFIQHKVLANYRTGNYGAVPTFPSSSTPKVNITSFNTARDTINARVGGGYVHAFYIGDQKATREHLADICVGSDLRPGINHHGQVLVVTLNDGASTSGLTTFTYTSHIEASTFDIDPRIDAIVNVVEVTCGREAATGRHPWPATTLRNEASVTQHGERIGSPLALNTTLIHAYAMDIAARKLQRMSQPLALVRFKVDLRGLALALGQLIRVTHFAGIGSTGWTDRVLMVTKISTDPNEDGFLCTIEAEDVHDMVGTTQMVIDIGTIDTAVLA